MLKEFSLKNATMVWSKNDIAYQDVLNDFKNANSILIVTFNISEKRNQLFRYLDQVKQNTSVQIFSNIPQRFEAYFNTDAKKRARKTINAYINRLNPENFSGIVQTYFSFDNHAKIIMTDNIAFIGSANFSDESKNNFEAGILSKDKDLIDFIKNKVVPDLIEDSEPFYLDDHFYSKITLLMLISKLVNATERIDYCCYNYLNHAGKEFGKYYDIFNNQLGLSEIEYLDEVLIALDDILGVLSKQLDNKDLLTEEIEETILRIDIDNTRLLYSEDTNIWDLASFETTNYALDYMQDRAIEADEEHLNDIANQASQEAFDNNEKLAVEAEEDIVDLLQTLKILQENLDNLVDMVPIGDFNNNVNNT